MTYHELRLEKEKRHATLTEACGLFWAFSTAQFDAGKTTLPEGSKYISIGGGGYLPSTKLAELSEGLKAITAWEHETITANNLTDEVIEYELCNHECYYTGSIEDALAALGEGYTHEQVLKVFRSNQKNHEDD